ncbi:MAG: phosphoribosylglycinamide formyltransferase [Rikenellaceae bacterium]
MNKIAIFASGTGTNAENIISYFSGSKIAKVALILSNKKESLVIKKAEKLSVESFIFSPTELRETTKVDQLLEDNEIDILVLAGFLLLMPPRLVEKYRGRIINIHPSLLPKFGGKGMYGDAVHKAVIEVGEKESGITIHHVNEKFDSGAIIFQAKCLVDKNDTAHTLALKVRELEMEHFPRIIERELGG